MVRTLAKIGIYVACLFGYASHAHGQGSGANTVPPFPAKRYAPGEVIVKLKSSSSAMAQSFRGKAVSQKGFDVKAHWEGLGLMHMQAKAGASVEATVEDLRRDPDVEFAEPNYIFEKANVDSGQGINPLTVAQTAAISQSANQAFSGGYLATGAPIAATTAWSILAPSGPQVIVAVIDTGLDLSHPVFTSTNSVWRNLGEVAGNGVDDDGNGYIDDVNGFNFVSHTGAMLDDDGHGTHVAGIVLATTQDIYNPPLADSKIKIMPLKFLDGTGSGRTSDAIEAIYYAVSNGAQVLNNSWGGGSYSASLHQAITFAYQQGVLFVAAAGNSATNNDALPMFPASYDVPNIVSVAATTNSDALAYFSNFGRGTVDMGSPGFDILSTYPGGYFVSMRGTSMATPFVAGLAALIKRERPNVLAYQIKTLITTGGDSVTSLVNKTKMETRLNVHESIVSAKAATIDTTQPPYTFTNRDRNLASGIAGTGCGTVTKMGGGPETWSILLLIALFAVPFAIWTALRRTSGDNRRAHPRYKIDTEVKLNLDGRELIGSISTIGLGGVQLNTNAMLDRGGLVRMSILSPDGQEVVEVEGRVVWSEANKAYGVQFQQARESVLSRIQSWTRGLVKT
jgi:subtilisin family serine protease